LKKMLVLDLYSYPVQVTLSGRTISVKIDIAENSADDV
jgi:hypothetical protein